MNLQERRDATEGTANRFLGHAFAFGRYDCGKMLIAHLRNMRHRPTIGPGGTWTSALGLKRFLARHGGSGAACLDGWGLIRIPPAAALIGDIVQVPGETEFGAFGISGGNGLLLGYHQDVEGVAWLRPSAFIAAWRV